jgi:hypothetical protein
MQCRQQKSQDQGGLQPNSSAFKNRNQLHKMSASVRCNKSMSPRTDNDIARLGEERSAAYIMYIPAFANSHQTRN